MADNQTEKQKVQEAQQEKSQARSSLKERLAAKQKKRYREKIRMPRSRNIQKKRIVYKVHLKKAGIQFSNNLTIYSSDSKQSFSTHRRSTIVKPA